MTTPPLPKKTEHQKFCSAILAGKNSREAYMEAYPNSSPTCADAAANRLRNKKQIQAYLTACLAAAAKEDVMSLAEKRQYLARVVRTPITAINPDNDHDPNHDLIQELTRSETDTATNLKIRIGDKLRAIELDSKLAGDGQDSKTLSTLAEALAALAPTVIPTDKMEI